MTNKELASKVAAILGAKHCQGPFSDNWDLSHLQIEQYLGFNDENLVQDWRVAGAIELLCLDKHYEIQHDKKVSSTTTYRTWVTRNHCEGSDVYHARGIIQYGCV